MFTSNTIFHEKIAGAIKNSRRKLLFLKTALASKTESITYAKEKAVRKTKYQ
jgi:hypothetical protein